jgi:hypothetical protein
LPEPDCAAVHIERLKTDAALGTADWAASGTIL